MTDDSMHDAQLGRLSWCAEFEGWEGSVPMTSGESCGLLVFARASLVAERAITVEARAAIERLRGAESACRSFASAELLEIHNSEWSEGATLDATGFERRLELDSLEVHESGYAEVGFTDGDLFWGHDVVVRIRPDGSFQEVVLAG